MAENAWEETTRGPEETEACAARLAATFQGGEVVLLSGELGAGKTAFVRGLARGLGADPEEVASPTFVLLTSYPGRLILHHADQLSAVGDRSTDPQTLVWNTPAFRVWSHAEIIGAERDDGDLDLPSDPVGHRSAEHVPPPSQAARP